MNKFQKLLIFSLLLLSVSIFYFSYQQFRKINSETKSKIIVHSKEDKYRLLKQLSVEVQINYYNKLLGDPTYINFPKNNIREYIYADQDYFVKALTNDKDKVISYAVTSREEDFNPEFSQTDLFKVILNKTTFSEWLSLGNQILSCYHFLGAHDPLYYFEEAYFGNPGNYLSYVVGINNSGFFIDIPDIINYSPPTLGYINCNQINQDDRKLLSPNTFIVRSSLYSEFFRREDINKDPSIYFGPDNIQVRTLNKNK